MTMGNNDAELSTFPERALDELMTLPHVVGVAF